MRSQTLNCASWEGNGHDLAEALSKVSGVPCKYAIGVPKFLQWLFMRDLYNMVLHFETSGFSDKVSVKEFKEAVPEAQVRT